MILGTGFGICIDQHFFVIDNTESNCCVKEENE